MQTLSYSPGQTATVFLEVLDVNGERADNTFLDGYYSSIDGYTFGIIDGYVAAFIDGYIVNTIIDGYITQNIDGYVNASIDGYVTSSHFPTITRIIFPDLTATSGYPVRMVKLDTGLYYYQFTLPTGATAVGSYLVDISYTDPSTLYTKTALYQIAVNAPYGQFSIAPR
jgi:hypothetical protein